jgi:hypothetical protein
MFQQLLNDDSGVIISAELVLVLSICVLGTIVGLSEVAVAINTELNDFSNAIGAINQTYYYTGFRAVDSKVRSGVAGFQFIDAIDDGDVNTSCDLVCAAAGSLGEGISL